MLDILNRRNQCSTMKQKSHYAEPYHCHTISRSTTTRHEISRNRPMGKPNDKPTKSHALFSDRLSRWSRQIEINAKWITIKKKEEKVQAKFQISQVIFHCSRPNFSCRLDIVFLGRPVIKAIKAIQASFDQKVRQQIKQQLLHCLHYQILPKKLKIFAQKMVDGNEIVKNENLVYLESQTANHLCIRSIQESVNITSNQLIRSNNYQYQLSFFIQTWSDLYCTWLKTHAASIK